MQSLCTQTCTNENLKNEKEKQTGNISSSLFTLKSQTTTPIMSKILKRTSIFEKEIIYLGSYQYSDRFCFPFFTILMLWKVKLFFKDIT